MCKGPEVGVGSVSEPEKSPGVPRKERRREGQANAGRGHPTEDPVGCGGRLGFSLRVVGAIGAF